MRYRDKKTGRFATKKKWERSHGRDGRYKREPIESKETFEGELGEGEY